MVDVRCVVVRLGALAAKIAGSATWMFRAVPRGSQKRISRKRAARKEEGDEPSIVTSPPSHPVGSCERFWLAARRVPVVATSSGPSLRGAGDVESIILVNNDFIDRSRPFVGDPAFRDITQNPRRIAGRRVAIAAAAAGDRHHGLATAHFDDGRLIDRHMLAITSDFILSCASTGAAAARAERRVEHAVADERDLDFAIHRPELDIKARRAAVPSRAFGIRNDMARVDQDRLIKLVQFDAVDEAETGIASVEIGQPGVVVRAGSAGCSAKEI